MRLNKVEVRREFKHIDILIIVNEPKNNFVFFIENKIYSPESNNQLIDYENTINKEFSDKFEKFYIYLIPDSNPYHPESSQNWNELYYSSITDILERTIDFHKGILNENIINVMNQYLIIQKRYIQMEDNVIKDLCLNIWRKHKQALNILISYKDHYINELFKYSQNQIESCGHFEKVHKTRPFYSTKVFDKLIPFEGFESNFGNRFLIYQLFKANNLYIELYLVEGKEEIRNKLFTIIAKENSPFNNKSKSLREKWRMIYTNMLIENTENIEENDIEQQKKDLENKLQNFFEFVKKIDNYIIENYK